MNTPHLSRRAALAAGAALPLAAGLTGARPAQAAADMMGATSINHRRFTLGGFEVTTLLGGSATREGPQGIFGMNVSEEEFAAVSAENFLPADKVQFYFTPTLVNTGSELVLFDAGLNAANTTAAIEAAGYTADQVDTVVITHMHGDHIGGLIADGAPTFANARYVTGAVEHNHWSGTDNENFANRVKPLEDQMTFIDPGASPASGITAMDAFGHTPGHMGYMIESDGKQLALVADLANHYVWSLGYPDWEVRFDMDKAAAAATRRRVLGMLAADKIPFVGYHMPFPALGYVAPRDDGFRWVPETYQMLL